MTWPKFCERHAAMAEPILERLRIGDTPSHLRLRFRPLLQLIEPCRHCWRANGETCTHPPAALLPELFCRSCGVWLEGQRIGEATNERCREFLQKAAESGLPVHIDGADDWPPN